MWRLYTGLLGYLAIETRNDIRSREISMATAGISGILALLLRIWTGSLTGDLKGLADLAVSVMPGIVLLAAGKVTRQAIGYGDGILLLICGLYLGGRMALVIFVTGLFFLFPVSLILLLSGKVKKEDELPFAPFLLLAYLVWLLQMK